MYIREFLCGVDARSAPAIEIMVSKTVRVVVAAVGITLAIESIGRVGATALVVTIANMVGVLLAGMRSEGIGVGV